MDTLEKLFAIEEIKQLKHRYFRAIDMADFDLLDEIFHPDIKVDYRGGTYRWEQSGKEAIIKALKYSFHSQAAAMHTGHHPEISIDSSITASGKWYLHDIFFNFNEKIVTQGTALYEDEYMHDGVSWKIISSQYDRIVESISPIDENMKFTKFMLKDKGIKL
ncbi:MAG: nuclear transport factor 2 family protein [Gammaproteobacteria bacterium]